jgi:hypothetical protein
MVEEMDACGDILYVAYGMAYSYGYNFDELLRKELPNVDIPGYTLFQSIIYPEKISKEDMIGKLESMLNELNSAMSVNQAIAIVKDIIHHIYKYQYNMGYNSDYIFDVIHKSNMTKLCDTEDDAVQTVNMYKEKHDDRFDSPFYYKLDNGKYVIKNKSTGKCLKSFKYEKVKFDLSLATKFITR